MHISEISSTFAADFYSVNMITVIEITKNPIYHHMSTFTITLNERTAQSQALLAYLEALPVRLRRVPNRMQKSSYERSKEDIRAGRVQSFASADDMCEALGI